MRVVEGSIKRVFKKFKNEQGNFNIILANDIQGLCNLYEAAQVRTYEDDILEEIFSLTKGYMVEAKWCHEGYIPTYNEYKVNGVLTGGIPILSTPFIGPGEFATKNDFDWILTDSKIIEAVAIIGRLMDDLSSHKFEQERVHIASAVECCMKQYDCSQSEAYNHILNDVEDCWKVINEACLKANDIPKVALDCVVNLARSFHFLYGDLMDKFTNSELLKDYTNTLLVDPVCINQD
ncbi:hypothetical protein Fmac_019121 [Flemingia macrophylla]|uniref:Terpene synthase metal-binding domain-containing protein n=1 Tax=Flemingia macrophylla TaxID=520843 RepID=A0ABD1M719_9FABA